MKHTTKEKVLAFIHEHPMAVLSTVSDDNQPWGSAIYCVADEDLMFYFVTREQTLKYNNIAKNPKVALTFADSDSQKEVQLTGVASNVDLQHITDVVFKKLARARPHGHGNWVPPIVKVHRGDWMVLCITPDKLLYADFKERKTNAYEEYIARVI
jgi:general stress protein 26